MGGGGCSPGKIWSDQGCGEEVLSVAIIAEEASEEETTGQSGP